MVKLVGFSRLSKKAQISKMTESRCLKQATRPPSKVLLVRLLNVTVNITLEAMHAVFSLKGGTVSRIVMFLKDNVLHVLVEMPDVEQATKALVELNGQCIYR